MSDPPKRPSLAFGEWVNALVSRALDRRRGDASRARSNRVISSTENSPTAEPDAVRSSAAPSDSPATGHPPRELVEQLVRARQRLPSLEAIAEISVSTGTVLAFAAIDSAGGDELRLLAGASKALLRMPSLQAIDEVLDRVAGASATVGLAVGLFDEGALLVVRMAAAHDRAMVLTLAQSHDVGLALKCADSICADVRGEEVVE